MSECLLCFSFTGDVGLTLLLFFGASVLTFVELIDVFFSCLCRRDSKPKKKHRRAPDGSHLPSSVRGTPVIQYETISQQPPKDMIYHSHHHHNTLQNHVKPPDVHSYVPTRTGDSGNGINTMATLPARKLKEIPPPRVHFANTDI